MTRLARCRVLLGIAVTSLAACSSILQLDELQKVDCADDCGGSAGSSTGANPSGAVSGRSSPAGAGGSVSGGKAGAPSSGSGGSSGSAGSNSDAGAIGTAGEGNLGPCPGGPAPPLTWKEHWFEHVDELTRVGYDDCLALYFDPEMDQANVAWLQDFLSRAWTYNLRTYGNLDENRLYAVFHVDNEVRGHAVAYYEPTHDFRSVIDGGSNDWSPGDYDLPAHLLSFVVESTAGHQKHGSPASWIWHSDAFAEIYKYDLYVGLGMQEQAEAAFDEFEPTWHDYPFTPSYWFADFYYPIWRDHGETQVLVKFFALLEQYYPVENGVMPDMTWGEYIHFLSGAAGVDVEEQATYAFGWTSEWTQELAQARSDYPAITYEPP